MEGEPNSLNAIKKLGLGCSGWKSFSSSRHVSLRMCNCVPSRRTYNSFQPKSLIAVDS